MAEADPWYRTFFERDYFDTFYSLVRAPGGIVGPEASERETAFIAGALRIEPGARLLDLCCGHGRHSVALARRGYDVTGLDLSAYHIELAAKAAADADVALSLINDDMRNLPVEPPFDAVVNLFSSFGYLESDDEDAGVIARVAEALKPGGRFLMDFNNSVRVLRQFQPSTINRLDDGTLFLEERRYDALTGRSASTWTHVTPDGARREREIAIRMYTPAELRRMFEAAGLPVVASYGDFDGSPLTMDSRRCILVGEKA